MVNIKLKYCPNCNKHLILSDFNRITTTDDGRSIFCTKCTDKVAKTRQCKHCQTCHTLMHFNHFPARPDTKDKLSPHCKSCTRKKERRQHNHMIEAKSRKGSFLTYLKQNHPPLYKSLTSSNKQYKNSPWKKSAQ